MSVRFAHIFSCFGELLYCISQTTNFVKVEHKIQVSNRPITPIGTLVNVKHIQHWIEQRKKAAWRLLLLAAASIVFAIIIVKVMAVIVEGAKASGSFRERKEEMTPPSCTLFPSTTSLL